MSKVRLQGHPNSSFSHGGVSYDADEDGFIEVPVGDAVTHAYSHQFKQTFEKPTLKPLAKDAPKALKAKPQAIEADESEQEKSAKEDAPKALKGGK